ncbi:hypothetical protein B9Z19DRAFT_1001037 [Tuber borchii]|uniref:C2H2-type domain-containing protein n=1 Tax=Tuber borchii TaxID=42251 RepID=A0A2T6ZFJ1_TUBBO|nr:hypothetical protein B9Z19DRAFT_1001037 [Tuber borchii]
MEPLSQSLPTAASSPKSKHRKVRNFRCNHQGCGKAFTRAEHLQRHELNHRPPSPDSPDTGTCKRCRAHFKRPDLLDRHMERHAQKDKLAGGEGLGVLVTRKRCWRDENGEITTTRPAASLASLPKPSTSPKGQKGKTREDGGSGSDEAGNISSRGTYATTTESVSPSYSTAPSVRRQHNSGGHASGGSTLAATATETEVGAFDRFQSQQLEFTEPGMFENGNFQLPSPPPPHTYQLDPLLPGVPPSTAEATIANFQAQFEAFSLDPVPSFTVPFTTLGGYAWSFGGSDGPSGTGGQCGAGFDLSQGQSGMEMDLEPPFAADSGDNDQLMATPVDNSSFLFDGKASSVASGIVSQKYQDFRGFRELSTTPPVEDHSLYFLSDPQSMSRDTLSRDSHTTTTTTTNITQHSPSSELARTLSTPHTQHSIPVAGSPALSPNNFHSCASTSASTSESPSPTLSCQSLPKIDEVSRTRVLSLIMQATTNANVEPQFDWSDPLLSLSALQNYLDLFFSRFNPSYPLLNRPSFDPSNVSALLLVSVLMLGATYGGKDAHQMAMRVHDVLRRALVSVGFMTPEVWGRKLGTNLDESGRERIYSLIIFMLRSNCGHCKRYY